MKRFLSLSIALLLTLSLLPLGAAAEDTLSQDLTARTNIHLDLAGEEGSAEPSAQQTWVDSYLDQLTARNYLGNSIQIAAPQIMSKDGTYLTAYLLPDVLKTQSLDQLKTLIIQLYPVQQSYDRTIYTHHFFFSKELLQTAVDSGSSIFVNSALWTMGFDQATMEALLKTGAAGYLLEAIPDTTDTKQHQQLSHNRDSYDCVSFRIYCLDSQGYPQFGATWEEDRKTIEAWSLDTTHILKTEGTVVYKIRLGGRRYNGHGIMVDLQEDAENPSSSEPLLSEGVTALVAFDPEQTRKLAILYVDEQLDLDAIAKRLGLTLDGNLGAEGLSEVARMLLALEYFDSSAQDGWISEISRGWKGFDKAGLQEILTSLDFSQEEAEAIVEATEQSYSAEFPAGKDITDRGVFAALLIGLHYRADFTADLPGLDTESAVACTPNSLYQEPIQYDVILSTGSDSKNDSIDSGTPDDLPPGDGVG